MADVRLPEKLPAPPEDQDNMAPNDCRIWIGNLDSRINEFTMLKLLQKYGSLEHFDFLYHKTGPDAGKPRGYCFATYTTKQEAENAHKGLHGKLALSKKLIVKKAKPQTETPLVPAKPTAALGTVKSSSSNEGDHQSSAADKIKAIEAKLNQMEKGESSVAPGSVVSQLAHSYGSAPTNTGTSTHGASSKSHKEFSYKRQRHVYNRQGRRR